MPPLRTTAFLYAASLAGACSGGAATLQDFVSQYPALNSVMITASVAYLLDPVYPACDGPAGVSLGGSFHYAASGEMWRSRSWMDHETMADIRTEVAYDGSMFQYYQANLDTLG